MDEPKEDRKKPMYKQGKGEEVKKGTVEFSPAFAARVEEVVARGGSTGEAIQIRCKILEGSDKNKVLRRNVKGPVQIGDILMLRETEFEARSLEMKGRASGG